MKKNEKTNVMRLLDNKQIVYESHFYEDTKAISGQEVASVLGQDPRQVFKTLVTVGKSGRHYVFVIPVCQELDLKKAAKAVGEKSVEMLPVKEITKVTGYVRGGCTAIGMKKRFPAVLDASAQGFDRIYVSGGKIGMQLKLRPEDLKRAAGAEYADVLLNGSREAHT